MKGLMRIFTYIILFIIVIIGITFAALNAEVVHINYYFGTYSLPVSLLIVCILVVGIAIGFLMGLYLYWKQRSENSRLNYRMRLVEKEIENLRTIPLKNDR